MRRSRARAIERVLTRHTVCESWELSKVQIGLETTEIRVKTEDKKSDTLRLSGWLTLRSEFADTATAANKDTKCFWGHGNNDEIVLPVLQKVGGEALSSVQYRLRILRLVFESG